MSRLRSRLFAYDLAVPWLRRYWNDVVDQIRETTGWEIPLTIRGCLLGLLPRDQKRQLSRRFAVLGLTVAKRRIAIHWMSDRGPTKESWVKDLLEWATVEEERIRQTRKDAKLPEVLLAWGLMTQGTGWVNIPMGSRSRKGQETSAST
ncbi:hypothetical protein NDU88_002308 [Pleurodeles waltl]|uniref:Transposase n=1 Tax=Pleurodeles waltl TaxID=8319 RepID=A0AAV7T264_PLEWA|nr:hypothetical protein NDU88_002308 [Pleurodeles waltl]